MEKEQILSTINEKLGAEGIKTESFQRTFSEYVDLNLPEEGCEPDDAYFNKHVKVLKSISGQFSHDLATQVEDYKKNYKPSPAKETDRQEPQPNKEVEELREQLSKLAKRLDEKESAETQQQLLSKVKAEMKKRGATDDYVLRQTLKGITLDVKKSVDELANEMLSAYDSEYTACRGKGAAPRNGEKSVGGKGQSLADQHFARKQKKEGWGKQPEK